MRRIQRNSPKFVLLCSFIGILNLKSFCQSPYRVKTELVKKEHGDCVILRGDSLRVNTKTHIQSDTIFAKENSILSHGNYKVFDIYNLSKDTVYVYSGLFERDWYRQPYVHQIDFMTNTYYLSFTPFYGYFKNLIQYERVLYSHYNWYSFIELLPNQKTRISVAIEKSYFRSDSNSIKCIDPYRFQDVSDSPLLSSNLFIGLENKVRFAVYRDINELCNKAMPYTERKKKQEDFLIIEANFSKWER